MKHLLLVILFYISMFGTSAAQVSKIVVGVDGLTCPLCSRGVELSLRKLKFVEDIRMDLENTTAEIIVKSNAQISLNEIRKKVDESGFTVRFCYVDIVKNEAVKITQDCIVVNDLLFMVASENKLMVSDTLKLRIADKSFNNVKDNKQNIVVFDDSKALCSFEMIKEYFYVIIL